MRKNLPPPPPPPKPAYAANDDDEEEIGVVVKVGMHMTQAGFAGDDAPRAVFPTVVGRPKHKQVMLGNFKDHWVGDECWVRRGILNLSSPLNSCGTYIDWDDVEKLFHHTFYNELRVCPEESSVLLTESLLTSRRDRERMFALMFETFNVPKLLIVPDCVPAIYASGRATGIVVNVGHTATQVTPIVDSAIYRAAYKRNGVGGKHVTERLCQSMAERGYDLNTAAEKEIVRDIKEKLCFVAGDYETELQVHKQEGGMGREYELPDGQTISMDAELFKSPEILFSPALSSDKRITSADIGIHKLVEASLASMDAEFEQSAAANIVLAGGSSLFRGLSERLKAALDASASRGSKTYKVNAPPERKYSVWIGCSIIGSLSTTQSAYVSKTTYDEDGPTVGAHAQW